MHCILYRSWRIGFILLRDRIWIGKWQKLRVLRLYCRTGNYIKVHQTQAQLKFVSTVTENFYCRCNFSENQVWDQFSTQSFQHDRAKTCHSLANGESHTFYSIYFSFLSNISSLSACVFPWKRKIVWGNTSVEQTNSLVALSTRWTHIGKRFSLLQRWKRNLWC